MLVLCVIAFEFGKLNGYMNGGGSEKVLICRVFFCYDERLLRCSSNLAISEEDYNDAVESRYLRYMI